MLNGRYAVITGGSRGIGRAIALEMAKNGAGVAIIYAGHAETADEVCAQARSFGVHALAYQCDVANWEATKAVCEQILTDFPRIDIIVNNAGIVRDTLLIRMSEEDYDTVVDVNLKGAFAMTRYLMRSLLKSEYGRVINISSVVGLTGNPGQTNYAASKAGLLGFTTSLARELAARKVTCNAIAPGYIATDMTAAVPDAVLETLAAQVPLRRVGTAEDVAHAAVFLASDMAGYITGEVLRVDGGMRM
jgi:3-oxoacyl-[acyl-carrier protein] reductase